MNRLLIIGCFLTIGFQLDGQNVIKVRSQHHKELIHVMQNENFYGRGESKIFIQNDGVGYEFIVRTNKEKFRTYKNGKMIGEFSSPRFSNAEYWETDTKVGDETLYTLHLKNGQKFGPHQYVSPYFSKENKLMGIRYKDKGKVYFKNLQNNKLVGPYDQIYVQATESYNVTYECKQGDQYYLFHNEEMYGPFASINCPYSYKKSDPFYFTFENKESEWQVFYKKEIPTRFTSNPSVTIFDNEKILINGETKVEGSNQKVFLIDDKKYEDYYYNNSISTNSFGDVLVLKAKQTANSKLTQIFMNDVLFGEYVVAKAYHNNFKQTSVYNLILFDSVSPTKNNLSIIKKDKIIPIGNSDEIHLSDLYVAGEDVIYIRKTDSTLIINGKETVHKKVTQIDYSNYPEESFIIKKQGRFDVILRNEKELSAQELEKTTRYRPEWYNLKSNAYSTERIDDKTYVYPKGSNKRFGPINRGSSIVFSSDKKHYAESDDRAMLIFLDGKRISEGFNIAYDPKTNAFHWLSIDKNNMYLHTYQNN